MRKNEMKFYEVYKDRNSSPVVTNFSDEASFHLSWSYFEERGGEGQ